jgi:hypothetical protein
MTKDQEKRIQTFLGYCLFNYKNTRFEFVPTKKLKIGTIECTGEAVKGRLTIATGGDTNNWLQVFLHETCHLDQQLERPTWFEACDKMVTNLDNWLGRSPEVKDINWEDIKKIIELEHDCESRSIEKIKNFNLPIDLEEYAQKANSYLESYSNTFKNRQWDSAPYTNPERWGICAKELLPLEHFTCLPQKVPSPKHETPKKSDNHGIPEL